MRKVACVFVCLACVGHGRRVQPSMDQLQVSAFNPSGATARLSESSTARAGTRRGLTPRMSADVPSIIVGGGRIGSLLASIGVDGDAVMKRGDPFPESPATGPIYVTTRNNDLAGVIESTPEHRRKDLVFMQNGMLGKFLDEKGLADNTQVLLYLAVAKLGDSPIDGITDLNPEGLTAASGEWAAAFADRLNSGNLKCRALDGDLYKQAMLEKHVWICSFMMVGALNGGVTVGDVESKHADEMKPLVAELCAAGEEALGVKLPEGAFDRLLAYGRSVAHFPTAVKEFEWRNGWFYDLTEKALAAGKPDPMPLHTAGLKKLGVIPEA
mmetsp:Transcript_71146/g.123405  ORF Transcript_71146/g.123405 Transcript_71146/m.123405 type:complete len:326 (-) Transcript_71146:120-1097(-)